MAIFGPDFAVALVVGISRSDDRLGVDTRKAAFGKQPTQADLQLDGGFDKLRPIADVALKLSLQIADGSDL